MLLFCGSRCRLWFTQKTAGTRENYLVEFNVKTQVTERQTQSNDIKTHFSASYTSYMLPFCRCMSCARCPFPKICALFGVRMYSGDKKLSNNHLARSCHRLEHARTLRWKVKARLPRWYVVGSLLVYE
jgi:hypothetical protein